jgi:TRAP-type C4-dicarboxylate transport system permease small subunit
MVALPQPPNEAVPVRLLGLAVDWLVVGAGAVMVVLVFVNVLLHLTGRDLAWVIEFCELLMVWVTFLGAAAATRRGAHMAVTELVDLAPGGSKRWIDAAIQGVVLVVLGLLAWYGWRIVQSSWGNVLTVLDWPMAWQYMALPIGSALTMVFVLADLPRALRGMSREERFGA